MDTKKHIENLLKKALEILETHPLASDLRIWGALTTRLVCDLTEVLELEGMFYLNTTNTETIEDYFERFDRIKQEDY